MYKTLPDAKVLRLEGANESADIQETPIYEFETRVCPDGYPYMTFEDDDGREPGFFFSVSGIKNPTNEGKFRFHFPHLSYQRKQIESFFHSPVYLKVSHAEYLELI